MAKAVVTLKIMPDDPEIDLEALEEQALEKINAFSETDDTKTEVQPVAFGLKALQIMFVMQEEKGDTEGLEQDIESLDGVMSCETTDVRRAIG